MKKGLVHLIGVMTVMSLMTAACIGINPVLLTEESEAEESEVIEQPTATAEEETVPSPRKSTLKIATDFTLPDGDGNMVSLAEELQENDQVVLVFYYGNTCTPCMAQLREIEKDRAEYEEKGAQVIAIAVQDELHASASAKVSDVQFPVLADKDHAVAEAFGVYETPEYEVLTGLSTPSVFIINQDQEIVWGEISHIEGSGCGKDRIPSQTILENLPVTGETGSSLNPVTSPDGEQVGQSVLEREADKIFLKFEACCLTPGNAYTVWWVIGDVTKPMSAVKTLLATGFVAIEKEVNLELNLEAGLDGINNPLDGVRLAVLDHGQESGDPLQLSTPGGGCTSMPCPVALETSHAAP